MSKKARRRRQAEEAERAASSRILTGRYKYVFLIVLGIIGAALGWLIGPRQAFALEIFCGLLGFVIGFLLDVTAQNRSINRAAMRFQDAWHGEVKHGGDSSPD